MLIAVIQLPYALPVLNTFLSTPNHQSKRSTSWTTATAGLVHKRVALKTHNLRKLVTRPIPNIAVRCSSASQGVPTDDDFTPDNNELNNQENKGFWTKWKEKSAEMSSKLAKLGLAAVLAYGLFDGVTYTSFFVLAFLGYEKSTGKNPAANLQALLAIVILMWTGNNVTRPFRVAGAAALAPVIDKGLRKIQKHFNFPSLVYAFTLVVTIVAGSCLSVVGLLILSRWGK